MCLQWVVFSLLVLNGVLLMKFEVRMLQAILLTFLLPRPRWWVFVLLVLFQLVVVLILTGVLLMRFVVLMLAANLLKESLLFLIVVLS